MDAVASRHSWWSPLRGKGKGAAKQWWFGEGAQAAPWRDKPRHWASSVVGGSWTRDKKKQRYLALDVSQLDSGLHKFVRSAARHYWRAARCLDDVNAVLAKSPARAPQNTVVAQGGRPRWASDSKLIGKYAQFRHDLNKARIYLDACMQLSLVCHQDMGLTTAEDARGDPLLQRVKRIAPELDRALERPELAPLRVLASDNVEKTKALVGLLEQWWANAQARRAAGPAITYAGNTGLSDPTSVDATGAQWIATEFTSRIQKLRKPDAHRKIWRHYKRVTQEADRQEKTKVGIGVAVGVAGPFIPAVALTVGVIGGASLKLSTSSALKPLTKLLAKVVPDADFSSLRVAAPRAAIVGVLAAGRDDEAAEQASDASLNDADADTALPGQDQILSASVLKQHELQSLAKQSDKLIIKAARHVKEAGQHLDALEALCEVTHDAVQDDQAEREALRAASGSDSESNAPVVTAEQAVAYYEFAHDLEKARTYLQLVTLVECSLDKALVELEQEDSNAVFENVMRALRTAAGS